MDKAETKIQDFLNEIADEIHEVSINPDFVISDKTFAFFSLYIKESQKEQKKKAKVERLFVPRLGGTEIPPNHYV